jgi:hypothetical protein
MATSTPVSTGKILAAQCGLGPANTEFVVNGTGNVLFKVGPSTATAPGVFPNLASPTYSTLPGTGLSETTKNSDVGLLINSWLDAYLLNTPPAPAITNSIADTQKIQIAMTLPPQKRLAFYATTAPYIATMKADIVRSSLNAAKNWADASSVTITLETIATNNFASVTTVNLNVDAGTNLLTGTLFNSYANILSEVPYDIRIYGTNQSAEPLKYATVLNIATLPVGTPIAPTGLNAAATSTTTMNTSWSKPADHDTNTTGNQVTPFISSYKLSRTAASTLRYGGVITDTGDSFTTTTVGSNSATSLTLSALNPGTTYSLVVSAKNSINTLYGAASSPAVTSLTNYPTAPVYLSSSDATALNSVATLRTPYNAAGGYTMDGVTAVSPVLNYNVLTDSNLRTTSATGRRTNFTEGATGTVGTLVAYGGLNTDYTAAGNTASFSAQGLNTASTDGSVVNGKSKLVYSNDKDVYTGSSAGFYKQIDCYASGNAVATNFVGTVNPYSLQLQYTPVGGSQAQSAQVTFYVDNAGTATSINNLGITQETGSSVTRISGVPTFTSSATFKTQYNQAEVAHYFLRNDKKHTDLVVTTSSGSALSSVVSITKASINASNKYFTAPTSNKYQTSATAHNSSGLTLAATTTPEEIQFNTFTVALNAAGNVFDEGLLVKATPYSLYSDAGGSQASGVYMDVTNGTTKQLRIDTKSVTADRSSASYATTSGGQQVSSGTGQYPSTGFGTAYDHTASLLGNEELQLVNGTYQSKAFSANGYKDYAGFYNSAAYATPNYSSITGTRWTTFKYSGKITGSTTYTKIRLNIVHSGLTIDVNTFDSANHQLQLRVDDPTYPTSWCDATNGASANGIGVGSDGTRCLDITYSSASQRDCIIRTGTGSTATFYVRIGIASTVAASVTGITLTPVIVFT